MEGNLHPIYVKSIDNWIVLDQLQLPLKEEYVPVENARNAWEVIHTMKIRGAPAIAIIALFGLAKEMNAELDKIASDEQFMQKFSQTVSSFYHFRSFLLSNSHHSIGNISEILSTDSGKHHHHAGRLREEHPKASSLPLQ